MVVKKINKIITLIYSEEKLLNQFIMKLQDYYVPIKNMSLRNYLKFTLENIVENFKKKKIKLVHYGKQKLIKSHVKEINAKYMKKTIRKK